MTSVPTLRDACCAERRPWVRAAGGTVLYCFRTAATRVVAGVRRSGKRGGQPRALRATPAFRVRELKTGSLRSKEAVSYTHLRAHETKANLVCRLLLEKKKK